MHRTVQNLVFCVQAASVLVLIGIAAWLVVPLAYLTYDANRRDYLEAAPRIHEEIYATVCPMYRDASGWDRWFSKVHRQISWCEDYLDRL